MIVVSRMRETQPLTESSAAAIGHSKQRRGWQSTVSRWIRPCAPRAPILPEVTVGNLAQGAPRDRVRTRSGEAVPLAGRGVGEVEIAGVGGEGKRQRDDAARQHVDRPVTADSGRPSLPVNARRRSTASVRSSTIPELWPVSHLVRWPRPGDRPRPGAWVPDD